MPEQEIRELVKQKLSTYTSARRECRQVENQIEILRASMEAPRTTALDGMPRGSGGGADALANLVSELRRLEEKYLAKLHQLHASMAEVEDMIGSLEDPVDRTILRYRYIDGLAWEEVCVRVNYSWRQTHNIHSRALDKLVAAEREGQ